MPANMHQKVQRQRDGDQKQNESSIDQPNTVNVPQARAGKGLIIAGYVLGTLALTACVLADRWLNADITLSMFFFIGVSAALHEIGRFINWYNWT